jgi:UDP-N-acetylmuramoyl-tripeptide--D-alanyl-D-alanine ligase
MGMNHSGEILPLTLAARPDTAVINSIAPCHIEHLGSLEGIAIEKGTVFQGLSPEGTAVIPAGIPQTALLEKAAEGRKILYFGTAENCDVRASYCGGKLEGSSFELTFKGVGTFSVNWHLSGRHQAVNASAAAAAAWSMGVSPETICAALPETLLPGMRSQITHLDGAVYINDAYNANPGSMRASFAWLKEFVSPEKLVLVLGEMRELGEYAANEHSAVLDEAIALFPAVRIITVGQYPERTGVLRFPTSAEAQAPLAGLVRNGDIVFAKGSRGIAVEKALPEAAR